MKERYQKVLSWKLEEYLPSDVVILMQEADLEVYLRRYVSGQTVRNFLFHIFSYYFIHHIK